MRVIGKQNQEILSWQDWERPRDKAKQWVEGRSAMEIARAFFRNGNARLPEPLTRLLQNEPALSNFTAHEVRPEFETDLPPRGSSGPRNHDVWLRGYAGHRRVSIGIEAKADEAFDRPLSSKDEYGSRRLADGNATDMPARLTLLGAMLFGPQFDLTTPSFSRLGYQLVTGVAGTVIQAAHDGASTAAFVIYEFSTPLTSTQKQARNATDLAVFVRLLPGARSGPGPGQIIGPIPLEAAGPLPHPIELYIGKVIDQL
jgi:hypothetical protein